MGSSTSMARPPSCQAAAAEIRAQLHQTHGLTPRNGSISNLCDRLLDYLEALHLARVPELRHAVEDGNPLHLDATCEYCKGSLLVCMDGWRGWVVMAARIASEHADNLRSWVHKTAVLYDDPIATVRDMGESMGSAAAPLPAREMPDFICRYHFQGAVSKKLFKRTYRVLGNLLL